ncbi:MAG TPA: hypothetical protein VGI06_04675 [Acidimicrobiales bacterium]
MAVCHYCNSEMLSVHACVEEPIVIEGRSYEPVRFRTEPGGKRGNGRCGDCGVEPGQVHHHGCDVELCPKCWRQSISCGCLWAGEEHLSEDWVDDMEDRLRL